MSFLDTKHKRKSFTITTIIHVLILLLLFFVGMTYLDPPIESGIAVNFGTSDVGSGSVQPKEAVKSAPRNTSPEPVPQTAAPVKEKVVTQEVEEAPVIKDEVKKETPKTVTEKPKEKPVEKSVEEPKKPDPKPDKSTSDALSSILNGPKSDGKASGGEGNDKLPGDGNVIKATPGVRGTTNNTKCLLEPAKEAALATRFNSDDKAPSRQIGKIVYKFSLSD